MRKRGVATGRRSCRGSAYIAVIGTTMLVTLLGLSGLTAVRLERATRAAAGESDRAAILAQSAVELALELTQATDWRRDYSSGQWSAATPVGGGEIRFRFIDEDGSLDDDENDPATVEGEGAFGPANDRRTLRRVSALIDPGLRRGGGGSIVRQGSMNSVSQWQPNVAGDVWLQSRSESGNNYLRIRSRSTADRGAYQDLTDRLKNPGVYDVSLRARTDKGTDTLRVKLTFRAGDGVLRSVTLSRPIGPSWGDVAGIIEPIWTGDLDYAALELLTVSHREDIDVDDVVIRERAVGAAPVVPGSWRRNVDR